MRKFLQKLLLLACFTIGTLPQISAHQLNLPSKPPSMPARVINVVTLPILLGLICAMPAAGIDYLIVEQCRLWDHSFHGYYHGGAEDGEAPSVLKKEWYTTKLAFILGGCFAGYHEAKKYWRETSPQGCVDRFLIAYEYLTTSSLVCDKNIPESKRWMGVAGPGCDRWPLVNLLRLLEDHAASLKHAVRAGTVLASSAKTYNFSEETIQDLSTKITELKNLQDLIELRIETVEAEPSYATQVKLEETHVDTITRNNRTRAEAAVVSHQLAAIRKKMENNKNCVLKTSS